MSRSSIGLVVVALASFGCSVDDQGTTNEPPETAARGIITCSDPDNCALPNGGGVYTEELGHIGFGANQYMISRFVNTGTSVEVQGRGYNPYTGLFYTHGAELAEAIYNGNSYHLVSVSESLTTPTFVLGSSNGNITLTGQGILGLQLVFKSDSGMQTLSFVEYLGPDTNPNTPDQATLQQFHAKWNDGIGLSGQAQEYCTRAPVKDQPLASDAVVFQQAIAVNPITAVMVRNNNFVTLSCRHGAIATARWWGYKYRDTQANADLFEAAMHMKRASYCGDDTFYTRANTDILINDGHFETMGLGSDVYEASWGRPNGDPSKPIRALCVNRHYSRHPFAKFPPGDDGVEFGGRCINPQTGDVAFMIYACPEAPNSLGVITDQAANPPLVNQ